MSQAVVDEIDRIERRARFAARKERDEAERQKAFVLEPPAVRERVQVGLAVLRRLLDTLPKAYRGPYAMAWDVESHEALDGFLARPDVAAAIEAARPVWHAPAPRQRPPAPEQEQIDPVCKESLHAADPDEPPVPIAPPDGPFFPGEDDYIPE